MTVRFGDNLIGKAMPTFVIAEAGANHNCDMGLAKELIDAAKLAGADAVKFQTFKAETLTIEVAQRYWTEPSSGTQYDSFKKLDKFGPDEYLEIAEYAEKVGIEWFSTPFDLAAVDLLDQLGVPGYKIASADLTYHKLLAKIAEKHKPMILSTGTSNIGEIEEALEILYSYKPNNVALLHCTLQYPCDYRNVNLKAMQLLMTVFPNIPVGLSDHTLGIHIPLAAVALGACVIEKHFTVDKNLGGSADHKMSIDPFELSQMVKQIRDIEAAQGDYLKHCVEDEVMSQVYARRSIVTTAPIAVGETIGANRITCKRPGYGIAPQFETLIATRTAKVKIAADVVLNWDMLA